MSIEKKFGVQMLNGEQLFRLMAVSCDLVCYVSSTATEKWEQTPSENRWDQQIVGAEVRKFREQIEAEVKLGGPQPGRSEDQNPNLSEKGGEWGGGGSMKRQHMKQKRRDKRDGNKTE